jgi:hypothetical protein
MHADGLLCAGHGVTRSFSASRLDARLAASLKDEANVCGRDRPRVESMSKKGLRASPFSSSDF